MDNAWAQFLLDVEDGTTGDQVNTVSLYPKVEDFISNVFGNRINNTLATNRAIICPKLENIDIINNIISEKLDSARGVHGVQIKKERETEREGARDRKRRSARQKDRERETERERVLRSSEKYNRVVQRNKLCRQVQYIQKGDASKCGTCRKEGACPKEGR